MRSIVLAAGLALFGTGSVQAQSAGARIAGPFTVTLPSTQTFSFSTGFKAPTPIQGSYVLRVALGAPGSLTAFSLRLNGAQVYSLSAFAGGVTSVDRGVTLLASNTIALSVAGTRGTKITTTVFAALMPKPVSLSPDPLTLNIGGNGTLTATLAPAPTVAGTLNIANSDPSIASAPASAEFAPGQTSVPVPVTALSGGVTTIIVSANGAQASATVAVDTPPSINIVSPAANAVFQPPATIQISASATDPDGAVSRVDFYQGGMLIGSASGAPYSIAWTDVGPGSYSLTAVATDNQGASTTSSAVTIRVNAPPAAALTSPAPGASFTAPATIQLIANALDSDGSVARVDFLQGTTPIGTASTAPYSFDWTKVPQGIYALTAVATDNDGAVTTSATVDVTVNSGVAQIYYIVPDHLNTPRLIVDQNQSTVWRNENTEPFGDSVPNADPNNTGNRFEFSLRFPGQYFDQGTNLAHNYFRDYDSSIGRYTESDPMGLLGGLNTYAYAHSNSLLYIDPDGKTASPLVMCVAAGIIAYGGYTLWSKYSCQNDCERDCAKQHMCPTGCPYSEGDTGPLNACKRVCFARCWLGMGKKGPIGPTPNSPPNNPSPAPAGPR
ncbi:MAG TPA: Ig-like domain-containing protein [Burkholderiales bacterium]|nr:Ig-like domain-containing protein [Burkholderiales bacterium]